MDPLLHAEETPVEVAEHAHHEEDLGDDEEGELGTEPVKLDACVAREVSEEGHPHVLWIDFQP